MHTVKINGGEAILGETIVISKGLNMRCKPVIAKSIICKNKNGTYFVKTGGIEGLIDESEFNEYYPNTAEGRKQLKATFGV